MRVLDYLKKFPKILLILYFFSFLLLIGIDDHFYQKLGTSSMYMPYYNVGEIYKDTDIIQPFTVNQTVNLNEVSFYTFSYSRTTYGEYLVEIEENGNTLVQTSVDASEIKDNSFITTSFPNTICLEKNKDYELVIKTSIEQGNGITIYSGNSDTGILINDDNNAINSKNTIVNDIQQDYSLCFNFNYTITNNILKNYKYIILVIDTILTLLFVIVKKQKKIIAYLNSYTKYIFTIKQLVSRDFKTRYKRSVLGVLWSLLNPFLMMTVQFIVFSTIFKSSVPNFALYLMVGIVLYNFFSEGAGMTLGSITSNSYLITKVNLPKFIYPLSRTLSSTINLGFSLIPILIVMIVTRTPITKALLLLPIPLICLFIFTLGIGLILATSMVFFRDTQFLWGILSMIWMYLTPIIYPESIIDAKYMTLYRLNPLYHILKVARTLVLEGITPYWMDIVPCVLLSVLVLVVGLYVFNKFKDEFVLYL